MTQKLINATTVSAERRKQRLSALGSLAQSTVTFVIFAVVILMILAELGYNITTILAGTTVIAVTVAFGLQSIVKDLVSGIFMLVEDQLGIGDYVDMEMASGSSRPLGCGSPNCEVRTAQSGTSETAKSSASATSVRAAPVSHLPRPNLRNLPSAVVRSRRERCLERDRRAGDYLGNRAVFLASSAAAWNCSAVIPGTTPVTLSLMPVIPSPAWKVTSARVSSEVGGCRPGRGRSTGPC